MTRFDDILRRGLMDANLAQYETVLQCANDTQPDFSPRYLRERMRLLADPWGWIRRREQNDQHRIKRLNWRLVAIIAALLLLSACAYAVVTGQFAQWFPNMRTDPEAPEVSEEIVSRMGTVIEQSQTVDGVTVTLNAAVWDGQWLSLSFTAEGLDLPEDFDPNASLYDLECRLLLAEDQREKYLRKKIEASHIASGIESTEEERKELVRASLEQPDEPFLRSGLKVAGQEGNTLTFEVSLGLFNYVESPELTLHIENLSTYEETNHTLNSAQISLNGTIESDPGPDVLILGGPYDFTFTLDTLIPPVSYTGDLNVTYEDIPMRVTKITVTPFQVRADFEILTQVDLSWDNPDPDKLHISPEQTIAMSLNGLWTEDGEYLECLGGATMNALPDGRAGGEMISTQLHLVDPVTVTAVDIGGIRVELGELEILTE